MGIQLPNNKLRLGKFHISFNPIIFNDAIVWTHGITMRGESEEVCPPRNRSQK